MERYKYLISLILVLCLVLSCNIFKAEKDKNKTTTQKVEPEKKDQYRVAEIFSDNKSQIIDLIEGPATFEIEYRGSSSFNARILNSDGTLLVVLAEVTGPYKGTKTITAPKTTSYILDVKTTGYWSVYRK
jgi:hypothetical protein